MPDDDYIIFHTVTLLVVARFKTYAAAERVADALGPDYQFDDCCSHSLPYALCPVHLPAELPADCQQDGAVL